MALRVLPTMPVAIGSAIGTRVYAEDDLAQDRLLLSLFKEVQQAQLKSASSKKKLSQKNVFKTAQKTFKEAAKAKIQALMSKRRKGYAKVAQSLTVAKIAVHRAKVAAEDLARTIEAKLKAHKAQQTFVSTGLSQIFHVAETELQGGSVKMSSAEMVRETNSIKAGVKNKLKELALYLKQVQKESAEQASMMRMMVGLQGFATAAVGAK